MVRVRVDVLQRQAILRHHVLSVSYVAHQLVNRVHGDIFLLADMLSGLEQRACEGGVVLQLLVVGGGRRGGLVLTALELGLEVVLVKRMAACRGCAAGRTSSESSTDRRGARLRAMVASGHESCHGATGEGPAWVRLICRRVYKQRCVS